MSLEVLGVFSSIFPAPLLTFNPVLAKMFAYSLLGYFAKYLEMFIFLVHFMYKNFEIK